MRVAAAAALAIGLVGCAGRAHTASFGPLRSDVPVSPLPSSAPPAPAPTVESPPPPGTPRTTAFPALSRATLGNGLSVVTLEAHALPIVELRAAVGTGPNAAARITAQLLREGGTRTMTGGEVTARLEALGAELHVEVGLDGTRFGMVVASDRLEEAVEILAEVLVRPRFDEKELRRVRGREMGDAEDEGRSDGSWIATRALFRELFPAASPYAGFEPAAVDIAKIHGGDARDFTSASTFRRTWRSWPRETSRRST